MRICSKVTLKLLDLDTVMLMGVLVIMIDGGKGIAFEKNMEQELQQRSQKLTLGFFQLREISRMVVEDLWTNQLL
jgi:hypothetical protein